jgi:hypothetical protein
MQFLETRLAEQQIAFSHSENRIRCVIVLYPFPAVNFLLRCFPHIINRCTERILSSLTNEELILEAASTISDEKERDDYLSAFRRNPISLCRDMVRVIRSSGQRRELFDEIRSEGNRRGWWGKVIGEDGKETDKIIDTRQLLRDVRTRWDSVYFMIRRVRLNHLVRAQILLYTSH